MIISAILKIITIILGVVFAFMPIVDLNSIPYIGEGLSTLLVHIIYTWNAFLVTFPYAQLPWNIFLYVIIPFEIGLIVLKFFLGSRNPQTDA